MPEPPRKKMNLTSLRNAGNLDVGSAIVFWHEAEGCPPAVRAISLRDLESINGNSVTEKTICMARYRGFLYHCIVIWIEEDKTPDELASMRLFPATSERTYEDKGYTWAAELGLIHVQKPLSVDEVSVNEGSSWMPGDALMPEPRSGSWDSRSELQEESMGTDEGAVVSATETPNGNGISQTHTVVFEHENGVIRSRNGQPGARKLKEKVVDLSAQVRSMQETITVLRQQKNSSADLFSSRKHLPTFLNSFDEEEDGEEQYGPGSPSMASPSSTNGNLPACPINEELMIKMLAQSTWKKALKLGMKSTFTIEELMTSVPTERGARMSKNGKKALDQGKLAMVKNMVAKFCAQKDIWLPSNELIHQELGGILFSVREANNPAPKTIRAQSQKPKEMELNHFRNYRGIGRKTMGAPIRPYSFKLPSFSSSSAMDLSDAKSSKPSSLPSST